MKTELTEQELRRAHRKAQWMQSMMGFVVKHGLGGYHLTRAAQTRMAEYIRTKSSAVTE